MTNTEVSEVKPPKEKVEKKKEEEKTELVRVICLSCCFILRLSDKAIV